MDLSQIRHISDMNIASIFNLRVGAEATYRQYPLAQLALDDHTVVLTLVGLKRSYFHTCTACIKHTAPGKHFVSTTQLSLTQLPTYRKENVTPH